MSGEISPEKINSLLCKLRLHNLTKEEARKFLPVLKKEIKKARGRDKREYEKIVIRLTEILKMYLIDVIDINKTSFDVMNELRFVVLSRNNSIQ
jgi:anthranilate phosphoribosyltransferase